VPLTAPMRVVAASFIVHGPRPAGEVASPANVLVFPTWQMWRCVSNAVEGAAVLWMFGCLFLGTAIFADGCAKPTHHPHQCGRRLAHSMRRSALAELHGSAASALLWTDREYREWRWRQGLPAKSQNRIWTL